jgi:hypothetical protein
MSTRNKVKCVGSDERLWVSWDVDGDGSIENEILHTVLDEDVDVR